MDETPEAKVTSEQPAQEPANLSGQPEGKHSRKRLWLIIVAAVVVVGGGLGAFFYSTSKPKTEATLKIGVMLPFSGDASTSGFGELKGIQLAKKQLGASNIELVQEDSKCDADSAAAAVKRLVAQKVVAIIGEACSGASLGALPDANKNKVVMISASASSPSLSIANDYFFRVVPPDEFQGQFAAQLIYNKGLHTAAMLYSNEEYGNGLSKAFKKSFEALGGTIVADTPYEDGAIDLTNEVNAAKMANPAAVYFIGVSAPSASAILQQMRTAGLTVPVYSGDVLYDDVVIDNAAGAAEGLTLTSFPTGTRSFKQALKNSYQSSDQTYAAAEAYDAFDALYRAIKGGAKTGEEIKNKLPSIDFQGVSGHIKFDKNGEISNSDYKYEVLQVKDGAFTTVE